MASPSPGRGRAASCSVAPGWWVWEELCLPWVGRLGLEGAGFTAGRCGGRQCFLRTGARWAGQGQPRGAEDVFCPKVGEGEARDCCGAQGLPQASVTTP